MLLDITKMYKIVIFSLLFCTYCTLIVLSVEEDGEGCNPFIIRSESLPEDPRFRSSVANGQIGSIIYDPIFHVNGFFNGKKFNSTYAKVPNPVSLWIKIQPDTDTNRTYALDMLNGVFVESVITSTLNVTVRMYAHQTLTSVMVIDVKVNKDEQDLNNYSLSIESLGLNYSLVQDLDILQQWENDTYTFSQVTSKDAESESVAPPNITIISTTLPNTVNIMGNYSERILTYYFVATVNDEDQAWSDVNAVNRMILNDSLYDTHAKAWQNLWEHGGRIDVEGNCTFAKTVNAVFYYLTSSLPMTESLDFNKPRWPFYGITPASLAQVELYHENYHGHVFWDQDTWMVPGIQLFYPNVIKQVLTDSRIRNLKPAQDKAKRLMYEGAMFPWELAYSGYDTSPWEPSLIREIHITGDVALAMQQYVYYTKDANFVLKSGAYEVLCEIAKFWASRVSNDADGDFYGAYDVMGPDEDHDHVNNSAYTNAIAQIALRLPDEMYNTYIVPSGEKSNFEKPNSSWIEIADNIYIPFDEQIQYHPEFDGFDLNSESEVKQADVVLLGYPLMVNMSESVRKNDLTIYENITRASGPAMTWAMHTIGWLEVGNAERAAVMFQKNFDYIRQPFLIWSEETNDQVDPGAINFVTGMGGFLQSILNGYFGIRVNRDGFQFNPTTLPYTSGYSIHGMKYLGNVFHARVSDDYFNLSLTETNPDLSCNFKNVQTGEVSPFQSHDNITFGKYVIFCVSLSTSTTSRKNTVSTVSTTSSYVSTVSTTSSYVSTVSITVSTTSSSVAASNRFNSYLIFIHLGILLHLMMCSLNH